MLAVSRSWGVCLSTVLLAACGSPPPVAPTIDVGPHDAARADAGQADANERDTGLDAADGVDAAVSNSCRFDVATDFFEIDYDLRSDVRRLSAAAGPTSFGIVYSKHDVSDHEDLYFAEIPSSGGPPLTTQQLTTDDFSDSSPVITRTSAGWLIAWLSNRDGNVEVYSLVDSAGAWTAAPRRQTTTPSIDETTPAVASDGTMNALAWAEPGAPGATLAVSVDAAGVGAAAVRLAPSGLDMIPTSFATTSSGYVVGWLGPSNDVWLQPLDAALATVGDPLSLTALHDGDGTVDSVVVSISGAAVYGVVPGGTRHEVHGHLLAGDGTLFHIEQSLTIGQDTGTDAAVAILGDGFVVAYRQDAVPPMLRVLLLDGALREISRADLVAMAPTGGPITARVAADGNVLLTWSDLVGSVNHMRLARLRCR